MDNQDDLVAGEINQLLRFTRSSKLTMSASDLETEEQLAYRYGLIERGYLKFVEHPATVNVNLNQEITLTDKGRAAIMALNPKDYASSNKYGWPLTRDIRRAQRRVDSTK